MKPFDIRYLDIVWNADQSVLKVEESNQPVDLKRVDQYWLGDTVTYPQKYFYLGICTTDKPLYEPYLKLTNDETSPLMPVKVPGDDKVWWIQKGHWDAKYNKFQSSLYRTAGRIEISAQHETIMLENHTVNFSVADLEYYLSDLKGKLWMLMLDSKSASKVNIQKETPSVFSDDVIKLFGDLASSFEAIIKKPHVTLSEIQEKLPRRLVKPVTKTFREIATHSSPKLLTSRSFQESYNTAENRFIHHLAFRTLYLLKALNRLASYQLNAIRDKAERDERWLKEESERVTKVVDPIVIDNEIEAITSEMVNQRERLMDEHQPGWNTYEDDNFCDRTYTVVLGKSYGKSNTTYFVTSLNGDDVQQTYGTYLVFASDINFKNALNAQYLSGYEFQITGSGLRSKRENTNGKQYYELYFSNINSIEICQSPLLREFVRLKDKKTTLESDGWVMKLSPEEQESIRNQAEITRARLTAIELSIGQLGEFNAHIPSLISRVKKSVQFFRAHKVSRQQESPNSMVFVQNPLYASAKSTYQKVSNLEGMDDSLLNSMMAIDEIGLVNLPNLYERWCLLQLITVISDTYRFQIQHNWQQKLVDAILKNDRNIEISFSCEARQLSLTLTYEKELDSGKRPDYVIDLHYNTYAPDRQAIDVAHEYGGTVQWYIQDKTSVRMVLDAKFRGSVSEQHIDDLIDELYEGKDYSEGENNAVFIVHPVAEVTKARTSPLEWGSYCNYGQAGEIDHKKGAIYLSPSREHRNSLENLQRLLGMFLQNHTCILDDGLTGNVIWHNKCCISCGGDDLAISLGKTKGGNPINKIRCRSCRQMTIETQCVACTRPLFKNGMNWTYHRTRAEQTTNIVCPNCETFL
jgi:hypothetical protein